MNKLLNIVKFILLIDLIGLNIYCIFTGISFALCDNVYGQIIYLILLVSLMFLSLKDVVKKENINNDNTYQVINIIAFIIMNIILCRTLFDSNLFFNNRDLINEIKAYYRVLYHIEANIDFKEYAMYYYAQNMIYFNIMLILLFIYRNINLKTRMN